MIFDGTAIWLPQSPERYASGVTFGGLQRDVFVVLGAATFFQISGCSGASGAPTGAPCSTSADCAPAKSSAVDATAMPDALEAASPMTSDANEAAPPAADAGSQDGEEAGAALGSACVPEQEQDKSFLGFSLSEVNVESDDFACASRICLVNHFQGRVTCPYGQSADGGGNPPSAGCTIPGTDTPIDGKDSNGTVVDPARQASVAPQCARRTASEAVVCSCRCANAVGVVDDAGPYCTCPNGFDCIGLVSSIGGADPGLSGAYCIRSGTEYDPSDASACGPTMLCDPKVANCGP